MKRIVAVATSATLVAGGWLIVSPVNTTLWQAIVSMLSVTVGTFLLFQCVDRTRRRRSPNRRLILGPRPADDAVCRGMCMACGGQFQKGEWIGFILVGPGADRAARDKCRNGKEFPIISIPCHWACLTGQETQDALDAH